MEARMTNPAYVLPDVMTGIQTIFKGIRSSGISQELQEIIGLRTSQINGCSACVVNHVKSMRKSGADEDKIAAVAAWQEAPYFSSAERAALSFAEHVTRVADRSGEAVPDALWDEIVDHFAEAEISGLLMSIGITNLFNRLNATTRQVAGAWS